MSDYHISLYEINYPAKFVTIEHRHVLGSLMSLGLKREKFGDILTRDARIQFFLEQEMAGFVKMEFQQIGKTPIKIKEIALEEAIPVEEEWQEKPATASSLRLDAILSSIYPISRQKAQLLIEHAHVKVNWKTVEDPAFQCREGDYFSTRGYGRSKLIRVEGKTKKEKWRIVTGILK
jgi:RNA-binding protein YlmH